MDVVDITVDAISVEQLTQRVSSPSCGAISSFLGTTRDNFKGKKVTQLEYEAYEPMARKEMLKICAQVRERWRVENIAIVHRIGSGMKMVPVRGRRTVSVVDPRSQTLLDK
ncbi:MOC2B-like protein [Mya arenaria]|uniref:MOC2B-like protein n=1 Tax=Mya arenaria TaxID=6604 RepID=A0ABY7DTK6_MYAAR|nr:MOC2B-like protein [Mya arenaria]